MEISQILNGYPDPPGLCKDITRSVVPDAWSTEIAKARDGSSPGKRCPGTTVRPSSALDRWNPPYRRPDGGHRLQPLECCRGPGKMACIGTGGLTALPSPQRRAPLCRIASNKSCQCFKIRHRPARFPMSTRGCSSRIFPIFGGKRCAVDENQGQSPMTAPSHCRVLDRVSPVFIETLQPT